MIERTKLRRSDVRDVRDLLAATFPEYPGRRITLVVENAPLTHYLRNYWDGGSRTYYRAVDLATGRVVDAAWCTSNPLRSEAHGGFTLPRGVALVEHTIFCGRDLGITISVRRDDAGTLAIARECAR